MRILFILKHGHSHSHKHHYGPIKGGGLWHSVKFIVEMLTANGVDAKMVEVIDNNDIDREVFNFKPDIVIIEALWVVPEKFDILQRLHPSVKWIVRIHSEIPFLAQDGVAIDWIYRYQIRKNVFVAFNSTRAFNDLNRISSKELFYLPNYYPLGKSTWNPEEDFFINVGCFGAIRPLKNQLIQAVAAVEYSREIDKTLAFHINGTRQELGGESDFRNIEALIANTHNALVVHPWMEREDFLELLSKMDIGLQLSLTESFNLIAADMVSVGLPMVVSPEIRWSSVLSQANPTSVDDILEKMKFVTSFPKFTNHLNRRKLAKFSKNSKRVWLALQ